MSQVIRYVDVNFEAHTADVKESFIDFIQIKGKDAASRPIANAFTEKLESDEKNP